MKNKGSKKAVLICSCLILGLAPLAYSASFELHPVAAGTYKIILDDTWRCISWHEIIVNSSIRAYFKLTQGARCIWPFENIEEGLMEFDISSLQGVFISSQMQALLTLTVKSVYIYPNNQYPSSFSLYEMSDANENGIIQTSDIEGTTNISDISTSIQAEDTVTIDVTNAVEHDLFSPSHSQFSGFVIDAYIMWDYGYLPLPLGPTNIEFYNNTDPVNAPKLTVSSTETLIKLSTFTATPKAGKISITWSTASEINNADFNIYRSETEKSGYAKINSTLIPAQGSPTQGTSYEFVDTDVKNRKTYYYKLEDVDIYGVKTMHGPVKSTPRLIYGMKK